MLSPLMLFFVVGTIVITIIINSSLFTTMALIGMFITIFTYIPIALVKAHEKSGAIALLGRILDILIQDDIKEDEQVREMEDAVMLALKEINRYYAKKLKQFMEHIKKKKEGEI